MSSELKSTHLGVYKAIVGAVNRACGFVTAGLGVLYNMHMPAEVILIKPTPADKVEVLQGVTFYKRESEKLLCMSCVAVYEIAKTASRTEIDQADWEAIAALMLSHQIKTEIENRGTDVAVVARFK